MLYIKGSALHGAGLSGLFSLVTNFRSGLNESGSDRLKRGAFITSIGAGLGSMYGLYGWSRLKAPAGFYESLRQLEVPDLISHTILMNGEKQYLVANGFDNLDADKTKVTEIYVQPDDAHLVSMFMTIVKAFNDDYKYKSLISLVAMRPSPEPYNGLNPFTREVLPRIIIRVRRNHEDLLDLNSFKNLFDKVVDVVNQKDPRLQSSGYQPRYSTILYGVSSIQNLLFWNGNKQGTGDYQYSKDSIFHRLTYEARGKKL